MNETVDAAATFRWYTIEAAEASIAANGTRAQASTAPSGGLNARAEQAAAKNGKMKNSSKQGQKTEKLRKANDQHLPEGSLTSPESRDKKGRRKVTFDMQPDVVTIKREVASERAEKRTRTGKDDGKDPFDFVLSQFLHN